MGIVTIEAIRDHYDSMAQVYRLFWGEHLHRGLFISGDERPRQAQEQMHISSRATSDQLAVGIEDV
jgi:hypothetical protein